VVEAWEQGKQTDGRLPQQSGNETRWNSMLSPHLVPLTILQQHRDEGCLPVQSSDGEGSVSIAVLCIDVDPPACQQVKDMRVGRLHSAAGMGGQ